MAIANAAILILLFGDSASTLLGKRFGKIKLPFQSHKTFEGSLAFLMVGIMVSLTQLPIIPALVGALAGTLTEAYSPIDDNVPIPLVSAFVMSTVIYILWTHYNLMALSCLNDLTVATNIINDIMSVGMM